MRKRILTAIAAVATLSLIGTAAMASHRFTDVGEDNIFHDDIAWMSDNGITYDPSDKTFLITGKNWPKLFRVRFVPTPR